MTNKLSYFSRPTHSFKGKALGTRLQVLVTSGYGHSKNTSLTYRPSIVGWDKSIGRDFLISPAPHRLDRTRLRQMNKMARHKQCQKLGGSRNADLTAPQGVTPQTLLIPNTTKLLHREGGWVTKLL